MGQLVDGVWQDEGHDSKSSGGHFRRQDAAFRNWITPDGAPGPTGEGGFKAEAGRYHLYISLACPWAHRTFLFRAIKGLEEAITLDIVHPLMANRGWTFGTDFAGATGDRLYGLDYLYEVYLKARPGYSGRVTVPVLWDKEREKIVSNEFADIIRMFNSSFDGVGAAPGDYYPVALKSDIDVINERVYANINNGVYKAGFATTQTAYDEAFEALFDSLDWVDKRLEKNKYLAGEQLTEADWRLFTTLVRFDAVYFGHFKCNKRRISDYHNLPAYLRSLYWVPAVGETVNMEQIKYHYYASHRQINPTGIVPKGPELDFIKPLTAHQ